MYTRGECNEYIYLKINKHVLYSLDIKYVTEKMETLITIIEHAWDSVVVKALFPEVVVMFHE